MRLVALFPLFGWITLGVGTKRHRVAQAERNTCFWKSSGKAFWRLQPFSDAFWREKLTACLRLNKLSRVVLNWENIFLLVLCVWDTFEYCVMCDGGVYFRHGRRVLGWSEKQKNGMAYVMIGLWRGWWS